MKPILLFTLLLSMARFGSFRGSAQAESLVIRDVTVIPGTGKPAMAHMTVVIRTNRIMEVMRAGSAPLPRDSGLIDGAGKYLIPGLWDMHVHLSKAGENTFPLFVANGVTSVRDMGGDIQSLARWKKEIEEGLRIGPRIKMAGPMLESATNVARMKREGGVEPYDRYRVGIGGPEEAEPVVARLAEQGVDFLKIRSVTSVETYRAIAAAAHKHHLALVGHAVAKPEEIIVAGQKSVEHGFYPPLDDRTEQQRHELFQAFSKEGIAVVPTFVVGDALLASYPKMKLIAADSEGLTDPRRKYLSGYLIEDWKEQVEEQKEPWPGLRDFLEKRLVDFREMLACGVRVMPGTDTAVLLIWPGFSLHEELQHFVHELGMTPMQAIVSATSSPAEFMGLQKSLGTIEKGKIADLVLLGSDPLQDISHTTNITAVIRDGRLFSQDDIKALLLKAEAEARGLNARTR